MSLSSLFIAEVVLLLFQDSYAVWYGREAEPGEFKYMVAVARLGERKCGGGIISPNHVLTAAHCLIDAKPFDMAIFAGALDWRMSSRITREVVDIISHEEFKPGNVVSFGDVCKKIFSWKIQSDEARYDIAVLTLESPLPIGDRPDSILTALNLPDSNDLPSCPCNFAGWGITEIYKEGSPLLFAAQFKVKTPKQCRDSGILLRSDEFCAQDEEGTSCTQRGDSGGPLVYDGVVYGVISHGGQVPKIPTAFSKVFVYKEFIEKAMKRPIPVTTP